MKQQTSEQLWVTGRSMILLLNAFFVLALVESRTEHGECRKLGNVQYRLYNSGEVITLGPCPYSCEDYMWEKKTRPTVYQPHGSRELQRTITAEMGGSYCCKCRGHPHQYQCCYGVAVRPEVEFKIVQFGEQTAAIRTNVSVLFECNVTGYPFPVLRRHGAEDGIVFKMKFNDTNPYEGRSPWSAVYRVEIPPKMVTHNLSGNYSCTGEVNFLQDGIEKYEDSTVSLNVTTYAEPRVVAHCQEPTKGNLTLTCTVDSSTPYTLSWLCGGINVTAQNDTESKYHTFHNQSGHFLVITGASKHDLKKNYTCVVTTAFSKTTRPFQCSFSSQSDTGLPGHINPSSSTPPLVVLGLLAVSFFVALSVVVLVYQSIRRKNTDWQQELVPSRSPQEPNEQPDLEADKELSQADEEHPSSEDPGQHDLRRRTGFS